MKKIFLFLIAVVASCAGAFSAVAAENPPFAYPAIPDSITDYKARSNYFVSHFWDRIDLKRAFSSKQKVAQAFEDYVAPMRLAEADSVYSSIARFMKRLEKQPNDMLFIASEAEKNLFGDSAVVVSDELYLAFIRPVVANKKISKALKARYEAHIGQLENDMVGYPFGELRFTDRQGRPTRFLPRQGQAVFIFLNDPDCSDCRMARVRLAADPRAKELIGSGELMVLALSPAEADAEWRDYVADYPEDWLVGADPDLDMKLDLRVGTPSFQVIDENGILAAKHLSIETLLQILSRI